MRKFREEQINNINNIKVLRKKDYLNRQITDYQSGKTEELEFPQSNVIQFELEDGTRISVRPSGTEPKIKFYFSVRDSLTSKDEYQAKTKILESRIDDLIKSLGI